MVSPTPEAEPVELDVRPPDILPSVGFTPDSYWLAEQYCDGGEALLLSCEIENGVADRIDFSYFLRRGITKP